MENTEFTILLGEIRNLSNKVSEVSEDVAVVKNSLFNVRDDVAKNTEDLEFHIAATIANTQRLEIEIEAREILSQKVDALENHRIASAIRKAKVKEICNSAFRITSVIGVIGTVMGIVLRLLKII